MSVMGTLVPDYMLARFWRREPKRHLALEHTATTLGIRAPAAFSGAPHRSICAVLILPGPSRTRLRRGFLCARLAAQPGRLALLVLLAVGLALRFLPPNGLGLSPFFFFFRHDLAGGDRRLRPRQRD